MTKWGRNISSSNINNNKNITTRRSEKSKTRLNKAKQQQSQKITSRRTAKRFFSTNEQSCGLSLSHVVVATIFFVLVSITTNNLSTVNCKLTRKTYTVWDLSPKEFESLLEQEKSLQKRKKSLDYFLRRRSKKTKEDLPSLLEEAPSNGNFLFEDGVSNNLGCLYANDVCTQDEICFDDLILGRCVSVNSEIDDNEGLQPLSTDDQSFLDAEVEQLLQEQGFGWNDPYTQCVLQTLISSFRYYGLEYDTTLCKAAFLPELSIERRVDVPKKFIIPISGDDLDSFTNDLDFPSANENNIIGEDDANQSSHGSSKKKRDNKSRTQNKRKRNIDDEAILLTAPPLSPRIYEASNSPLQILNHPGIIYGSEDPENSVDDDIPSNNDDDDDNNNDSILDLENGPTSPLLQQYQPINFLVRQEEDGGILIEPDQISSSTTDSEDETENKDDIIPIQVPHQPQESHLDNLIWMANSIQNPYQEIQPNSQNVIDIVAPSQKQDEPRTPLKFSPAIWLEGEDASVPSDNNGDELNLQNYFDQSSNNPPIAVLGENEGEDGNLDVENSFDLDNGRTDDYVVPFNGIQQDQIPIMKKKRALSTDEGWSKNADEEEELTYLPIYNDPDEQFLIRHKFSPISKRSENSQPSANPQANVEEFKESYEYPVLVSVDGKEIPSVHYTRHEAEEPSGLREDIDVYEPTLRGEKDAARIYLDEDSNDYEEASADSDSSEGLSGEDKPDNENSLGSFTFNRKERLDVKKPGPFFRNSENNFFFNKLLENEDGQLMKKQQPNQEKSQNNEPMIMLGDPFGPRRSNYSEDGKGQIEYEMPLQVLNPDPKKRFLATNDPIPQSNDYVHLMMKKRFDRITQGEDLIDLLAIELGVPRHALTNERIEDHHVQFRVEPNPQNIDANTMADSIGNDINLKKRVSSELGVEVAQVAAGDKSDYDVSKFPATSISSILYIVLVATSTFAILVLSAAILVLTKHCIRRSRENSALTKLHKQDVYESERGKVQEEYKQLCRDWSKKSNTNTVQPQDTATSKTALVSDGNGKTSPQQPTSAAIKKVQNQDSKSEGSNRSSTSSWGEEPTSTNMDISTGHMVLAYMEDHLKNKQRLEQEWVALCGYEAEPCATTIAFKTENKKKNRYPDKLPYDHNRVILNAVLNGSNSDYINASSVTDHDPRNPSYIVTQGPLAQTVADFWQMIWEQGCVVIVMLSRLQDNGYQLCHRYWPEEGSEQYHIFEVHLVSEHVWCDDYLVRSVYLKNTRTGETRTVTQFHFRSWPAQSVPSSTKALLEFRRKVNKSYRGRSAPICVHCSDGVGRAGTYVLIDMVLNRMAKGCKEIDIAATLEHIRDQRSGMVQTRPQFEFCLMAVAEEVHAILKALLP